LARGNEGCALAWRVCLEHFPPEDLTLAYLTLAYLTLATLPPATLLQRHYSSDTTPATLLRRHFSSDSSPATFRTSDFCCRLLKGWLLHSCLVFDYNSHTYWRYSNILVNTHTKQRFVAPWACIYPHKNCPTQSDLFISKMEVVANKHVTMSHCFPQRD
jgi:hypothetical protein